MYFEDQPEIFAGARLFVYGTLRKGFRSHELLQRFHARQLGNGCVRGCLYDLGEHPGATESEHAVDQVHGELYFLPQASAAFRVLDRFEGCDPAKPEFNLFERRETTVKLARGRQVRAWIYWLPLAHASGRRIITGKYAPYRS
jgi:gamma-glutamylcyclotransferase (GGCT)/AIG2-like uncharacterized protein YtfP